MDEKYDARWNDSWSRWPWRCTLLTKLAVSFNGIVPGVTAEMLPLVNLALRDAGGVGTARVRGAESQSRVSPSPLTALGDQAAARNNEPSQDDDGLDSQEHRARSSQRESRATRAALRINPEDSATDRAPRAAWW